MLSLSVNSMPGPDTPRVYCSNPIFNTFIRSAVRVRVSGTLSRAPRSRMGIHTQLLMTPSPITFPAGTALVHLHGKRLDKSGREDCKVSEIHL